VIPSSPPFAGRATGSDYRWLFASVCLSVVIHGLLALIQWRSPTTFVGAGAIFPAETRLKVSLQHARPIGSARSSAGAKAVIEAAPLSDATHRHSPARNNQRRVTGHREPLKTSETPSDDRTADASPLVDLDAAREIARQTVRSPPDRAAVIERKVPDLTEPETVLGRKINRATRADCRTSYADAGLLAIPLLLRDAAREAGCKW
jgi:hypothetical protein